ncbi:hypothetical protein [Aureibacter tunicatorum]|uniref:Phenylacetate-CoA ligase n=1 Tax=Aureibacter tunicatorum TaxID=866807 RepID=A0AAE4BSB4_9BACT|nr:hypothetical protein [Aureibacter tunicatorum]MDR6238197.1 phenylacetate-CoA ligase [Aureibacter tunicatorum]BDD03230.1 hypothetical protein AUTU_07130 [Aureibacter tunicatorum]
MTELVADDLEIGVISEELFPNIEMTPKTIEDVVELPTFLSKINLLEKRVGKRFEQLDLSVQQEVIFRRLQQLYNILSLNPLWKQRFENHEIFETPQNFSDWQQLPISDKEVTLKFFSGKRLGMVVPLIKGGFEIVASGGTSSGTPSETVYSIKELKDSYVMTGHFMSRHVMKPHMSDETPKWAITTYADYQMWSSGTMIGGVLQEIPDATFIGAGPVGKEVFQHMMAYEGDKLILGMTEGIAFLKDLSPGMSKRDKDSFKLAMFCSGLLSEKKARELKQVFPELSVLSYFSATQAEAIGIQLSEKDKCLTEVPGLHFIEIVDEEGKWVEVGEEGEILITRLHANEAPLIRYKLGDRMVRRPNLESQELQAQQFDFVGRTGDMLHVCDMQFSAPRVLNRLIEGLRLAGVCDLSMLAYEMQFRNIRQKKVLSLAVIVEDVFGLRSRLDYMLGEHGTHYHFVEALISSMSIFGSGEANTHSINKTDYRFEIKVMSKSETDELRTKLGKLPLVRDFV